MLRLKKTIDVDGKSIDIWLGLDNRKSNGKFTVYLLTDDPLNPFNHAEKLVSGIDSKNEAIYQGIKEARRLFRNILKNQQDQSE